jgi:hypothetical protein
VEGDAVYSVSHKACRSSSGYCTSTVGVAAPAVIFIFCFACVYYTIAAVDMEILLKRIVDGYCSFYFVFFKASALLAATG